MSITPDDRLNPNGADRSNWRDAPFSRWAFGNVREIIPVADIEHDPETVRALPEAPQSLSAFKLPMAGASLSLDGFLQATATDGMVVLRDGHVVFEAYGNGATRRTPHILMSVSKAVTGLLAGILQRNGDLATDALVSDYLPEIAGTAYEGATIRHLLDMRTGIALDDHRMRDYETASNWAPVPAAEPRLGFHAFFQSLPVSRSPHGGPFSYVSPNTDLLGWVMERATGRRFADLAGALLWKPMGAGHGAHVTVDCEGAARCAGGLCATVRDLARVGQLMLDDGRRGNADIIPAAWIDDIATKGDREAWRNGAWGESFAPISPTMSYRSGWYVIHEEPQTLFAMGVHGQNLFIDRANRLVIAKLSSQDGKIEQQAMALTHRAVPEIRRRLMGTP